MKISNERMKELLELYFIMGSPNCLIDPTKVLEQAIEGGITIYQYREKGKGALIDGEKYQLAKKLQHICNESGIPFIVNDDVQLAIDTDADGVHIGQDDEDVKDVRKRIGDKILGVSVHTIEEAEEAITNGADYLGLGPIFPTVTKEDAKEVQGTILVKRLRDNGLNIPIVAIGGIDSENASKVIEAGANGISVISAICQSSDIVTKTRELRNIIKREYL